MSDTELALVITGAIMAVMGFSELIRRGRRSWTDERRREIDRGLRAAERSERRAQRQQQRAEQSTTQRSATRTR